MLVSYLSTVMTVFVSSPALTFISTPWVENSTAVSFSFSKVKICHSVGLSTWVAIKVMVPVKAAFWYSLPAAVLKTTLMLISAVSSGSTVTGSPSSSA